jgi:hypothetical protein
MDLITQKFGLFAGTVFVRAQIIIKRFTLSIGTLGTNFAYNAVVGTNWRVCVHYEPMQHG